MNFSQLLSLDPSSFKRNDSIYTLIKYGFLYNKWATQEQGGGLRLLASQWAYNSGKNYYSYGLTTYIMNHGLIETVRVGGVMLIKASTQGLNPGEWYYDYEFGELSVRGFSDEDFSIEEDGHVRIDYSEEYSIIPEEMKLENWDFVDYNIVDELLAYIDPLYTPGDNVSSEPKKLCDISTDYWNEGGTNDYGFTARGSGARVTHDGKFYQLKGSWVIHIKELNGTFAINTSTEQAVLDFSGPPESGCSIRLVRPATVSELLLPDGILLKTCYTGNDKKIYPVTKINNKVWLASNLAETKWGNGSWIKGFDEGEYTSISNANWILLEEPALCAYYNNLENV